METGIRFDAADSLEWKEEEAMAAELFDFQGKVVLVTGGSRGLGRQMAVAFARSGADVAVTSRKIEACEEVAAEIEALGRQALAVASHVGHWDELDGLVDAVYDRFGRLDVLVNNAGMSPLYPSLEEVSEDLFDKVIAVNLKGPFRLSALVGSRMAAGDGGCILNILEQRGRAPQPGGRALWQRQGRPQRSDALPCLRLRAEGESELHPGRSLLHRRLPALEHGGVRRPRQGKYRVAARRGPLRDRGRRPVSVQFRRELYHRCDSAGGWRRSLREWRSKE